MEKLLYKLTDENGYTRNGTLWGENVTHTATGNRNQGLCSSAWIHAYEHPLIAVLMNSQHAAFKNPRLWEARGEMGCAPNQTKCGVRSLTTVKELPLPVITTEQYVTIAILCALEVYGEASFVGWAGEWLDGRDRSGASARSAYVAAYAAYAADAAYAAAYAAATTAATAAAAAAYAAAYVATDAAYAAAYVAAVDNKTFDLIKIVEKVCQL